MAELLGLRDIVVGPSRELLNKKEIEGLLLLPTFRRVLPPPLAPTRNVRKTAFRVRWR